MKSRLRCFTILYWLVTSAFAVAFIPYWKSWVITGCFINFANAWARIYVKIRKGRVCAIFLRDYTSTSAKTFNKEWVFRIFTGNLIFITMAWTIFCMEYWVSWICAIRLGNLTSTFASIFFEGWVPWVYTHINVTNTWTRTCVENWKLWIIAACRTQRACACACIRIKSWSLRLNALLLFQETFTRTRISVEVGCISFRTRILCHFTIAHTGGRFKGWVSFCAIEFTYATFTSAFIWVKVRISQISTRRLSQGAHTLTDWCLEHGLRLV